MVLDPTAFWTLDNGVGLLVFLAIGLLGGAHCLGMCGPLVTTYADRLSHGNGLTFSEIRSHALFNTGRILSYATIGATLGLLGGIVFDAAAVLSIGTATRAITGIVVGVVIIAVGVGYVTRGTNALSTLEGGGTFARVYGLLASRIDDWIAGPKIMLLGAIHGFLPCPILYPAFLFALASGSPVEGGLALGALGLGTFPTLFLYGTVLGSVSVATRRRLHRVLGIVFVVMGYLPISMGLRAAGIAVPLFPVPFYQPL